MCGHTQLTQEERYQIYILKKAEYSHAEIAEVLERYKSTTSRVSRRNRGLPQEDHNLDQMRRNGKVLPRISSQVWQQVEDLIREELSTEQIVGRVAMELGVSISREWIYQ